MYVTTMIGNVVKEYCKENKITYKGFAQRTGESEARIIRIVNGEDPDLEEIKAIVLKGCGHSWLEMLFG